MTITKVDFSKLSILVIDDSQFVRKLVEEVLRSFGVGRVISAESADEGFAQIERHSPHVIICDWQMYPVDGITFLRRLRQDPAGRYRSVPFIMLTGQSGNDDVSAAIREGADSYIVKPVSAQTLMNHLLKVIIADKNKMGDRKTWAV